MRQVFRAAGKIPTATPDYINYRFYLDKVVNVDIFRSIVFFWDRPRNINMSFYLGQLALQNINIYWARALSPGPRPWARAQGPWAHYVIAFYLDKSNII